jgi:hypothetical protein
MCAERESEHRSFWIWWQGNINIDPTVTHRFPGGSNSGLSAARRELNEPYVGVLLTYDTERELEQRQFAGEKLRGERGGLV